MKRIIIGGLAGGVAFFIWGAIAHMVLQVGSDAFKEVDIAKEARLQAVLSQELDEDGLYYLPWIDMGASPSDEEMEAYNERHEKGPIALIVFHKDGAVMMPPSMLVKELISNVLAALIVACLAGMMTGGYLKRAFAVAGFGAVGWLSISASNMIWFRFPVETFIGEGVEQMAGWLIVGFVIAKIVPSAQA